MASLISPSVGFRLESRKAFAVRMTPGVQKPHWMAPSSMNALEGVELPILSESFDGQDALTIRFNGKDEAGIDRLPVKKNRAASAVSIPAPLFGACEAQIVPQRVDERLPGLHE